MKTQTPKEEIDMRNIRQRMRPYQRFIYRLERQMTRVKEMEESLEALSPLHGDRLIPCGLYIDEPESIDCSCPIPVQTLLDVILEWLPKERQVLDEMLFKVKGIPNEPSLTTP